jgi:phospholipase/carboxylesterase
VPDHYEAAYAYPLIVWLKGESAPRESLCAMMRRISDRNCFGFSVRAAAGSPIDVRIHAAVTYLRQRYHVHSERIYLGGQAEMAASAIEIGLDLPEWFAGLVALSPIASRKRRLLARFDAIRGIRVFLACGDDAAIARNVRRTQRLLWGAGLSVHAVSSRSSDELDSGVLREIDRWLIQAIEEVEAAV